VFHTFLLNVPVWLTTEYLKRTQNQKHYFIQVYECLLSCGKAKQVMERYRALQILVPVLNVRTRNIFAEASANRKLVLISTYISAG